LGGFITRGGGCLGIEGGGRKKGEKKGDGDENIRGKIIIVRVWA